MTAELVNLSEVRARRSPEAIASRAAFCIVLEGYPLRWSASAVAVAETLRGYRSGAEWVTCLDDIEAALRSARGGAP